MGMKADSEWPADTTQSEDIGARRESVSRSTWGGGWDVAERANRGRWLDGDEGCGLLWPSLLKDSWPIVV